MRQHLHLAVEPAQSRITSWKTSLMTTPIQKVLVKNIIYQSVIRFPQCTLFKSKRFNSHSTQHLSRAYNMNRILSNEKRKTILRKLTILFLLIILLLPFFSGKKSSFDHTYSKISNKKYNAYFKELDGKKTSSTQSNGKAKY